MENDRGLDDLFGSLDPDEEPRAEPSSAAAELPKDPGDASALLNAAFIEAATAPVEPVAPSIPGESTLVAPAPDVIPAGLARPIGDASTDSASIDESPGAGVPPLTRRELRERRAQGEELPDTGAAETLRTEPFIPPVPAVAPVDGEPSSVDLAPAAAASPFDAAPFDPAPELGSGFLPPATTDAAGTPASDASSAVADSSLAALAQAAAPASTSPSSAAVGTDARVAQPVAAQPTVSSAPRQQAGRGFPIRLEPAVRTPRRSLRWLAWFLPLVIVLGGIGVGGWWAWSNYEDKIREILGWEIPNDYVGTGNGQEVVVTILPGDFGDDIAITLHQAGVTKSFDAFHDLLVKLGEEGQEPTFQPGNYRLEEQMSAQSALDALLDPANKITNRVVIPEGANLPDTLEILSEQSGIPLEEFQAQAANFAQFGLPANAVSLEGYLYPASYDLDGTETAVSLIQRLVNEMFARLDDLGVVPDDRNRFLTLASIVQKESGPNPEDPPKIARVFQNRIDTGMALESDATVTYGTCVWGPTQGRTAPDTCGTVWLNQSDIDDTSNPYNTRALPGLPPGPIAMPGQAALDAVAHPANGPWLFFVAVNLATGETVFSETIEEHDAAVERLNEWCNSGDPEAASYCA